MQKGILKNWTTLVFLFVLSSFFTIDLNAQTTMTPEQFSAKLEILAPNRPAMERTTLEVDVFYASDVKFKYSENMQKLNDWKTNYSLEYAKCLPLLTAYIQNSESLSSEDLESDVFIDLNAQWAMLFNI